MTSPRPPSTALHTQARWHWVVLLALLATIPAFYIELLEASPHAVGRGVYLLAAVALGLAQWRLARLHAQALPYLRRQWLDGLLVLGLLASALAPASGEFGLPLLLRFTVAGLSLLRMTDILRPWITRGSLRHVLALSVAVLGLCGIGFWLLEPKARTIGDGLWLAFTTAATVGYGDIVPTTLASKIFAVFVVLLGYAAISLVTASIAAVWVESSERKMEQDILRELHAEVRALREELRALKQLNS
jgi:voltage-gated potassium channel